jgi:uncharacterized protein YjiS (DUF1127 family)
VLRCLREEEAGKKESELWFLYFTPRTHPPSPESVSQPLARQADRRRDTKKRWVEQRGGVRQLRKLSPQPPFDVLAKTGLQRDLIANELIK